MSDTSYFIFIVKYCFDNYNYKQNKAKSQIKTNINIKTCIFGYGKGNLFFIDT